MKRLLHLIGPLLVLLIFAGAIWLLHNELKHFHYSDLKESLHQVSWGRVIAAIALTAVNYLILVGYDYLAVKYVGHRIGLGKVAIASFIGYVSSFNFGALLGGTSVRYRLYSAWGFSAVEIVELITFLSVTFWIGVFTLASLAFLIDPPEAAYSFLPFGSVQLVGAGLLAIALAYFAMVAFFRGPLKLFGWQLPLPSLKMAILQIGIAAADLAVVAGVLYVLLPPSVHVTYPAFVAVYLLASAVAIFTHVPGGIGILELVIVTLVAPDRETAGAVLASLLLFRAIYYLLPLFFAALLLAGHELVLRKETLGRYSEFLNLLAPVVIPRLLAFLLFLSGTILLVTGALPLARDRIEWVRDWLPLFVLEASHLLSALVGVSLLLLARGLYRRLAAAYTLSVFMLALGILSCLLRGLDYESSVILLAMLLVLMPSRHEFYRKASLLHHALTPGWLAAVAVVVLAMVWLGIFAYKRVEYSSDLWQQFGLQLDAARFLRAALGAIVLVFAFALIAFWRSERPVPVLLEEDNRDTVEAIVRSSRETYAFLALFGDKRLLVNEERNALLMYGMHGRSWVALGDPVGAEEGKFDLIWEFRELCDAHDAWPIFYQAGEEHAPLYVDLGLSLLHLGDEARVWLPEFSLEGKARKPLRHTHQRFQLAQCGFEVVFPSKTPEILDELKFVSDAWLACRDAKEKRFSFAWFQDFVLRESPVAVVRRDGRVLAFAQFWESAGSEEVAVGLLRSLPDAPRNVVEYLLIELMLWGRLRGYRWFNLGVAPIDGMEDQALMPIWNRVQADLFPAAERFGGVEGVRALMKQFGPKWRPRYLVSPGELTLPRILQDIAGLVSGEEPPVHSHWSLPEASIGQTSTTRPSSCTNISR